MQYTALLLAAITAASALPGPRRNGHQHHHHKRHAKAEANYDTSGVNWAAALADVDWNSVNFDSTSGTTSSAPVTEKPIYTTTVAVVGKATTLATTTPSVAAGNVATAPTTTASTTSSAPETPSSSSGTTSSAAPSSTTSTSSSLQMSTSSDEYSVEVINNCAYTIWQAGWQTNTAGALISSQVKGNQMSAGNSISLAIPKAALGVQLWARTGCSGSGSSFSCQVGDCQGFECTSIIWQGGPIMAEFGSGLNTDAYNTDITAYDISAIPGNNVGVEIVPSISTCETKLCPQSGCSTDQAWLSASDTDLGSPADTTCSDEANFTVTFCPA